MTTQTQRATYPFFVYGTLRPGCHNYDRYLAESSIDERRATLAGAEMFVGPGFPYVRVSGTGTVTGDLVWVDDYRRVLDRVDRLEGYRGEEGPNLYDRALVQVETETGEPVTAWVYYAGKLADLDHCRRIESGDWLADVFGASTS